MKKLLIIFGLILTCLAGDRAIWTGRTGSTGRMETGSGGSTTYLLSENCEGTGTPSGWGDIEAGGLWPDWDGTGVVLEGSQSLRLHAGNSCGTTNSTFSAQSTCELYAIWQVPKYSSGANHIMSLRTNGTLIGSVRCSSTNSIRLYHGTIYSAFTGILPNTTYHIWLKYTQGTGSDGVATLYVATNTATKPSTAQVTITTGNGTSMVNTVTFYGSDGTTNWFDKVRLNPTIGSNPD